MKLVRDRPAKPRNELKAFEIDLGGRDRSDFGTVRPRVQIPGPRPKSEFSLIPSTRVSDDSVVLQLVSQQRRQPCLGASLNSDLDRLAGLGRAGSSLVA